MTNGQRCWQGVFATIRGCTRDCQLLAFGGACKHSNRQIRFSQFPCRAASITECIYWLIQWRFILEKTATLTIQLWGNSLAVRIPSSIARSVGFKVGQPVEVSAQDSAVRVAA